MCQKAKLFAAWSIGAYCGEGGAVRGSARTSRAPLDQPRKAETNVVQLGCHVKLKLSRCISKPEKPAFLLAFTSYHRKGIHTKEENATANHLAFRKLSEIFGYFFDENKSKDTGLRVLM